MKRNKIFTICILVWMALSCNSQNKKQEGGPDNTGAALSLAQLKDLSIKIDNEFWEGDSVVLDIESETTEGGELVGYFDKPGKIVKLKAIFYGETGKWLENYYVDTTGKLYYLQLESISYSKPIYDEEDKTPFVEKKSAFYEIAFYNNQITEYALYNGKRKFEGDKTREEENIYWQTNSERLRRMIDSNSKKMLQERYRQISFEVTKTKPMFCMKYGESLFSFINLTEDIDEKNRMVVLHPQFAVVKLELRSKQFEWIKTNQVILVQSCDKIEVHDDFTLAQYKGKTRLLINYIITNGKDRELHKKWIDPVDLSGDVEITNL